MNDTPQVTIAPAGRQDVGLILEMIDALAGHLGLSHEMVASEADLYAALFGPAPKAEVVIARVGGEAAGFALYYDIYSTFRGRCGLHLEDLYVHARWRGSGIGRMLLSYLAQLTLERDCGRLEWWVLADDPKATAFYESVGASAKDEWTVYRLKGEALRRMAAQAGER